MLEMTGTVGTFTGSYVLTESVAVALGHLHSVTLLGLFVSPHLSEYHLYWESQSRGSPVVPQLSALLAGLPKIDSETPALQPFLHDSCTC